MRNDSNLEKVAADASVAGVGATADEAFGRIAESVPEILANAGGETVSYFEWVQGGYYWTG